MSKKWFVFPVVAILAGSAFSAEKDSSVTPNLDKGTRVLEGAGSANLMADELHLQLSYGRLVADGLEVSLVAGLNDSDVFMSTELGLRAEYNLSLDSALVPFVGASAVWADVEADESGVDTDAAVFSAGAGLKYFMSDDVALAMNMSYLVATDDIIIDAEDEELEDDDIRFLFSIRYYFD